MEKMERKINNTETDKAITIPYFAHEGEMFRLEQIIKKLWITVILLILLLVGTNGVWIWYESQFEETTTVTQDTSWDGDGNVVLNGTGEVTYNERSSETDSYENP